MSDSSKRLSWSCRQLIWLAVCAGCLIATTAGRARAQSVWGLKPYRILVLTSFGSAPEFSPRLQRDLMSGLIDRSDSAIGAAWRITVTSAQASPNLPTDLAPAIVHDVGAIPIDVFPRKLFNQFDKIFLMAISKELDSYRVEVREFDMQTKLSSTVVSGQAWQLAKLRDVAFSTLLRGFAPLALIETVKSGDVQLWLKASSLPPLDPAVEFVSKGDAFRPIVRFEHRDGRPKSITPTKWTYLTANGPAVNGRVDCKLITGLRSPLAGRRRGRVRQLALAIVPPDKPSKLLLQTRAKQILPGYDVFAYSPDSPETTLVGRSDWRGEVDVPPAANPIRVLVLKNGDALLARLPIVPGLEPTFIAEIPNDDVRLRVEGIISGIQEELVDLVTQREILVAQIKSRIESEKLGKAADLLEELDALPKAKTFLDRLRDEKEDALKTVQDKGITRKVEKLFEDTQTAINQFLTDAKLNALRAEWRAAREPGETADAAEEKAVEPAAAEEAPAAQPAVVQP